MSSTRGFKVKNEVYPTPTDCAKAMVDKIEFRPGDVFLEPCRGLDRAIYNLIPLPIEQKMWAELAEGVDYLRTDFGEKSIDVIMTNPPFSLTEEFLWKSLRELKDDGTLIMMQRLNYLGSIKRVPFWQDVGMPDKLAVIVPRPRFVGCKSDSCEYAWYIYDRGGRIDLPALSNIVSGSL